MVLYYAHGSTNSDINESDAKKALQEVFQKLGEREKVIIIPMLGKSRIVPVKLSNQLTDVSFVGQPDYTRLPSRSGMLTRLTWQHYGDAVTDIMPALGTHTPVTEDQRRRMFGDVPASLFRVHDWRNDVVTIGEIPAERVKEASDGALDRPWPAQLNKLVWEGGHDLVLSIGQVVPHEVMGMANHSKNLFIGVGGKDAIDLSHFIGAAYGMERMMGRADNPLRRILTDAANTFLRGRLPVVYVLTVVGPAKDNDGSGGSGNNATRLRGLFIGDDSECFDMAARLSMQVNFTLVDRQPSKVVVFLDELEFRTTWLGNKAIYRTRMMIADGGELLIMAPGVSKFGEDPRIDALIREFGYRTTPEIMEFLQRSLDLRDSLSAAAHLIHGSSENRFTVVYCPGGLTKEEIEGVGMHFGDVKAALERYPPKQMKEGWNVMADGEEVFYVGAPAQGLWAAKELLGGELEGAERSK